jgi:AraC family transcriptional regulator
MRLSKIDQMRRERWDQYIPRQREHHVSIVAKSLWFIEGQFARCPSLDDSASAVGTTRFHLSRTFKWATGHSIMAYVRGRRLTEAYTALAEGAQGILAVAVDAGYGSHEAFTRAFRDQFGVTPDEVRRGFRAETSLLVEPIQTPASALVDLEEPRLEKHRELVIAGLGDRFRLDETQRIPSLWHDFQQYAGSLGEKPGLWYGVCGDWGECGDDFYYMAGVQVLRTDDLPATLRVYRFPEQMYLVFKHKSHVSQLPHTMAAIFARYLEKTAYQASKMNDYFELYGDDFNPLSGLGGLEVWMPIAGHK